MRKQTVEAPEEEPKGGPAPPVPEINPRKQAAPHPTPAPRKLAPASSMPCIPSSADGGETRLRAQSDSRGQSESSSPEARGRRPNLLLPLTFSPLPQLPWRRCQSSNSSWGRRRRRRLRSEPSRQVPRLERHLLQEMEPRMCGCRSASDRRIPAEIKNLQDV